MFTLYHADITGSPGNCFYPHKTEVTDAASLSAAVSHDYVCAAYKKSYRSSANFIGSDCLALDCDNDFSEDPADWKYPSDIAEAFPGVSFAVHYSRSHMLEKNGRPPRPKFHVFFPIRYTSDPAEYAEMKRQICALFPYFDPQALDAARFFFGTATPEAEIFPGSMTLTDFLENEDEFDAGMGNQHGRAKIPEGSRNATMSRFAARVLKRYGCCDRAFEIFMEESQRCDPPLEQEELGSIWASACRFAKKLQAQAGYVPPEQYNRNTGAGSLKPSDYSDIGQAKVLTREYGNELCYTDATDYLRYNGEYWNESKQLAVGAAEEFLDLQLADAEDAVNAAMQALLDLGEKEADVLEGGKKYVAGLSDEAQKAYFRYLTAITYKAFVMKRRDMKYITSALQAAKPMLQKNVSDLDSDGFLLNTPGATYDLRQGLSGGRQPSPEDYITKQTAFAPGDKGKEIWREALNTFFCGDQELIDYVQQIVGIAAVGKVYLEALIIAYGEGRNGKSTFWNTLSRVMGSYAGSISADTLTAGCTRNVKPELAELKGKRIVIAAELEEGMRLSTSVVKQLSSTDEITAEKKYKDPFRFKPSHMAVLYTNHLPKVGALDEGTWRRLIVIPFNAKIEGSKDIKNYTDYLVDNAGPAIMRWIIEGAQKAIKLNYHIPLPACVAAANKAYRENNDWLTAFLEESCVVGEKLWVKSGELYLEYRAYCARNGEYTRSTADFYTALEHNSFERKRNSKGVCIYGLSLKDEFLN